HFGWVCPFKNLSDVQTCLTIHPADAGPVTEKSAGNGELTHEIYCRQRMTLGEGDDLLAAVEENWIGSVEKAHGLGLEKLSERVVNLTRGAGLQRDGFETQLACTILGVRLLGSGGRIARVHHQGNAGDLGSDLPQQLDALRANHRCQQAHARHMSTWPIETC